MISEYATNFAGSVFTSRLPWGYGLEKLRKTHSRAGRSLRIKPRQVFGIYFPARFETKVIDQEFRRDRVGNRVRDYVRQNPEVHWHGAGRHAGHRRVALHVRSGGIDRQSRLVASAIFDFRTRPDLDIRVFLTSADRSGTARDTQDLHETRRHSCAGRAGSCADRHGAKSHYSRTA